MTIEEMEEGIANLQAKIDECDTDIAFLNRMLDLSKRERSFLSDNQARWKMQLERIKLLTEESDE